MPLGLYNSRPSTRFGAADTMGISRVGCPNSFVGYPLIVSGVTGICANMGAMVTSTAHNSRFIGVRNASGRRAGTRLFIEDSIRAVAFHVPLVPDFTVTEGSERRAKV